MVKIIKIVVIILAVLLVAMYAFLPKLILGKITDYEPFTFDFVLSNAKMVEDYGIQGTKTPADYNFVSEDVQFSSIDGTRLDGWYIKSAKPSDKCIILVHGRTSNRLKTMKYLALVDSLDLDTLYNVFIPDLRNSGNSEPGSTFMGYKFGEDLAAAIKYIDNTQGQKSFILYGFSMGAMAICNTIYRPELKEHYGPEVKFEKIILDSPLSNVKETLRMSAGSVPGAEFLFDRIFDLYSEAINDFGDSMKISTLIDPNIPTLILQSADDKTTDITILENELEQVANTANVVLVRFQGPGHVRMFQDPTTREQYIAGVRSFLNN